MEEDKTVGEFIKEKRAAKGYSRAELARSSRISEDEIAGYEEGVLEPDIVSAVNMAYAFDISLKEMVFYVKESISAAFGVVCIDLNKKEQFTLYLDCFLPEDMCENVCVFERNILYMFSLVKRPMPCQYYLLQDADGDFGITSEVSDDDKIVGWFIRFV